jgi:phosphoglycerate dehydrogenase-like enzyme
VLITPHIGGMTREAQEIAYHRVADMLIEFFG